jgi:hypothetical protein
LQVAAAGLKPSMLGKSIAELQPTLLAAVCSL